MVLQCFQRVIDLILEKIGIAGGVLSIIEYIIVPWMIIGLLLVIAEFLKRYMNITVRQSRQSGVARATCPD